MCQFSPFCYPKVKENKMKPWKRHVLTTHTVCKHCWLICYETDMGPEIPTAAADQNFAWICKQQQDLIGSVLSFRTKIIGPEIGLVRCGYLNAVLKSEVVRIHLLEQIQTTHLIYQFQFHPPRPPPPPPPHAFWWVVFSFFFFFLFFYIYILFSQILLFDYHGN